MVESPNQGTKDKDIIKGQDQVRQNKLEEVVASDDQFNTLHRPNETHHTSGGKSFALNNKVQVNVNKQVQDGEEEAKNVDETRGKKAAPLITSKQPQVVKSSEIQFKDRHQRQPQDHLKILQNIIVSHADTEPNTSLLNKLVEPLSGAPSTLTGMQPSEFNTPMLRPYESSEQDDKQVDRLPVLPPPLPLLPQSVKVQDLVPDSIVKGVIFRELKDFKQFPDQANDELGQSFRGIKGGRGYHHQQYLNAQNMATNGVSARRRERQRASESRTPSPVKEMSRGGLYAQIGASSSQARLEQRQLESQAHGGSPLVHNVVYLRDVAILKSLGKGVHELSQRDVFQHENFVDVKELMRERETSERMTDQFESAIQRSKRQQQPRQAQSQKKTEKVTAGTLNMQTGSFKLAGPNDHTLVFESRFESGNLFMAMKMRETEYDLLMQNDTNTLGHTQWFYFQVKNTRQGVPVKFNILNYSKPDSMFNYGMKVAVYSDKKSDVDGVGWHRACTDIRYFKNQVRKENSARFYHTLTFSYQFEHDQDSVFFAYCFPYTLTDLNNDIREIERNKKRARFVQRTVLCKTLSGLNCHLLTITEQQKTNSKAQSKKPGMATAEPTKPGVVISARVHPGETVGSWMMRGVLRFLTDPNNEEAKLLRRSFVFKIIPMLNPDGVVNGNYRCSLAGCDLNRRWKFPSKLLQPTVYNAKRLIKRLHLERKCIMYCDLHGHSRKPNVFMYGCDIKGAPETTRIFPLILSQISPLFSFSASRFGVQKSKESTARVAIFKELKSCPLVYTMESTFSGLDIGPYKGMHISTQMLESMGRDLCRALLIQCNLSVPDELDKLPTQGPASNIKMMTKAAPIKKQFSDEPPSDTETNQVVNQRALTIKQALLQQLQVDKALVRAGQGDSSSGSDSEPSEDNMTATELVKNLPTVDKPLSFALKQEQQARKELTRQKIKERTMSPNKGECRWRVTTTANLRNQAEVVTSGLDTDNQQQVVKLRKAPLPKISSFKLNDNIKSSVIEYQSQPHSPPPLKVTVNSKAAAQTKDKAYLDEVKSTKATDATLQQELMIIKRVTGRNNQHTVPTQQNQGVQLRVANMELTTEEASGALVCEGTRTGVSIVVPSEVHTAGMMRSESSTYKQRMSKKHQSTMRNSDLVHAFNSTTNLMIEEEKQRAAIGALQLSSMLIPNQLIKAPEPHTNDSLQPRLKQLQEFQAVAKAAYKLSKEDKFSLSTTNKVRQNSQRMMQSSEQQVVGHAYSLATSLGNPTVLGKRTKQRFISAQQNDLADHTGEQSVGASSSKERSIELRHQSVHMSDYSTQFFKETKRKSLLFIRDQQSIRNSQSLHASPTVHDEDRNASAGSRETSLVTTNRMQESNFLTGKALNHIPQTMPQSLSLSRRENYVRSYATNPSEPAHHQSNLSNFLKNHKMPSITKLHSPPKLESRRQVTQPPRTNQQVQRSVEVQGLKQRNVIIQLQPMAATESLEALPQIVPEDEGGFMPQYQTQMVAQYRVQHNDLMMKAIPSERNLQLHMPNKIYQQSLHQRGGVNRIQTEDKQQQFVNESSDEILQYQTTGGVSSASKPCRPLPGGVRKQMQNQNINELYKRVYSQPSNSVLSQKQGRNVVFTKASGQMLTSQQQRGTQSGFVKAGLGGDYLRSTQETASIIPGSNDMNADLTLPKLSSLSELSQYQVVANNHKNKQSQIKRAAGPEATDDQYLQESAAQWKNHTTNARRSQFSMHVEDRAESGLQFIKQPDRIQVKPCKVYTQLDKSHKDNKFKNHNSSKAAILAEAERAFDPQRFRQTPSSQTNQMLPTRVSQLLAPSNDYSQSAFAPVNSSFQSKKASEHHSQRAQPQTTTLTGINSNLNLQQRSWLVPRHGQDAQRSSSYKQS